MPSIRSIRIEGLAGRQDVCSLTFNDYVNVLFGPNGSGKTSVLRILHSALSNETEMLKDVPFTKAEVVIYVYGEKSEATYRLDKTVKSVRQAVTDPVARPIGRLARASREILYWQVEPPPHQRAWFHKDMATLRLYTLRAPTQTCHLAHITPRSERR